jgi:hypothetical protein
MQEGTHKMGMCVVFESMKYRYVQEGIHETRDVRHPVVTSQFNVSRSLRPRLLKCLNILRTAVHHFFMSKNDLANTRPDAPVHLAAADIIAHRHKHTITTTPPC